MKKSIAKKIKQIEAPLQHAFPKAKIDIYEYLGGFRIRIVDKSFAKQDRIQRDDRVFPILRELDYELFADIDMLLLRAPGEKRRSPLDEEFDHPEPLPPNLKALSK